MKKLQQINLQQIKPLLSLTLYRPFCALLVALLLTIAASSTFAAPNDQSGQIDFSNGDAAASPFVVAQKKVSEYWNEVDRTIGTAPSFPVIGENEMSYINAVYLFCTINNGTCPAPLDALYELDLLSSKTNGAPECPLLSSFWHGWIKNGLEDRQRYQMKTAYLSSSTTFTNSVRPRYIKCQDTIKADLARIGTDDSTWKKRYSAEGEGKLAVEKFNKLLRFIEENKINVFTATGATSTPAEAAANAKADTKNK